MGNSAFAAFFHGPLAGFADALVAQLPATDHAVDGAMLRRTETLDALLDRFAADRGSRDRRATASQWSRYLFSRLIIPVTVIQLGRNRALDLSLTGLQIALNDDATPRAFVLTGRPDSGAADGTDFSSLLDAVLTPLVEALSTHCRLAPRVFWSNAAVYYDWVVAELAAQRRLPRAHLARAAAWLERPYRENGARNPLYAPYKRCPAGTRDGNGQPATHCRRLCCMQDLDARWGLCANCPRAVQCPARARAIG